ncbi:gp16 family protein [Leeia aquatica]|uniref:Regulatory protein GemA n=1 Tax=Leeia aquatica TaxID=2725557 RepID=A0A847S303_9NEIS|nr:regulatory protein GemA [Leeia aquatica]NLR73547.1 regulatory protein GemA [Leeia aquatica]
MTTKTYDRTRLIRLIHVARRELGLDDGCYRAILLQVATKTSAADLSASELQMVLDHMKRLGFKVRAKSPVQSRPLAQDAEARKVRALWLFLHELGVVKDPSERALASYVKRIAGVDALQWVDCDMHRVIETMKKWVMRFLPQIVQEMAAKASKSGLTMPEQDLINNALSDAFTRMTFDPMHYAWQCLSDVLKRGRAA